MSLLPLTFARSCYGWPHPPPRFKLISRFWCIGAALAFALFAACGDAGQSIIGPVTSSSIHPISATTTSSTSDDSISWNDGADGVLEYTDTLGNTYRAVREGPAGAWTTIRMYKNGIHKVTLELEYDASGELNGDVLHEIDSGYWMNTEHDGDIEETDTSGGGGGGTDGPVETQSFGHGAGKVEGKCNRISIQTHSDEGCSDEHDKMQLDAWEAATAGVVGAVAIKSGRVKIAVIAVGNFFAQTFEAGSALVQYGLCEFRLMM